jgi:4-hydroxybenzoate polyprenyltransferase
MPYVGVVTDSLYAHLIPGLIVLFAINSGFQHKPFIAVYAIWLFLMGVRNIMSHHLVDYYNDLESETVTSATRYGKNKVKKIMNFIISPLEVFFFIFFLALFKWPLAWIIPVYLVYIFYVYQREMIFVTQNVYDWTSEEKNNYNFLGGVVLNEFYEKWLSIIILMMLTWKSPIFLLILILHLLLFARNTLDFKKDYRIFKNLFLAKIYWFLARVLYYNMFMKTKHFLYWKISSVKDFIYWGIYDKGGKFVKYKIIGKLKHLVYWSFYKKNLKEKDDEG